jgi:hypothetical protein
MGKRKLPSTVLFESLALWYAKEFGFEGFVAKRKDSVYESGKLRL